MNVYVPLGAEGFELCHPVHESDFETINAKVDGTERSRTWLPLHVRLVGEDEGMLLKQSDSPWLGAHALILRERAMRAMRPLLHQHGEFLPLDCDGASLVLLNPVVADLLDESLSSVARFSNGRIMRIRKHVFRSGVDATTPAFKIPNLRVSPTFVTDGFVDLWHSEGLTGLDFTKVWSST